MKNCGARVCRYQSASHSILRLRSWKRQSRIGMKYIRMNFVLLNRSRQHGKSMDFGNHCCTDERDHMRLLTNFFQKENVS